MTIREPPKLLQTVWGVGYKFEVRDQTEDGPEEEKPSKKASAAKGKA